MTSRYRECLPWLDMQDTLHIQDTVRMPAMLPMATHMLAMLATQLMAIVDTQFMAMVDTQLLTIPGLAMLAYLLDIMDCWLCLLHQQSRRTIEIQGTFGYKWIIMDKNG